MHVPHLRRRGPAHRCGVDGRDIERCPHLRHAREGGPSSGKGLPSPSSAVPSGMRTSSSSSPGGAGVPLAVAAPPLLGAPGSGKVGTAAQALPQGAVPYCPPTGDPARVRRRRVVWSVLRPPQYGASLSPVGADIPLDYVLAGPPVVASPHSSSTTAARQDLEPLSILAILGLHTNTDPPLQVRRSFSVTGINRPLSLGTTATGEAR